MVAEMGRLFAEEARRLVTPLAGGPEGFRLLVQLLSSEISSADLAKMLGRPRFAVLRWLVGLEREVLLRFPERVPDAAAASA